MVSYAAIDPLEAGVVTGISLFSQPRYPETEVAVLSEYTFDAEIPPRVRAWCREHHRYLIAGGKKDAGNSQYYNTAFVVNPEGNVVFEQVKSVPIQFFKDGLPAASQRVWVSPWGKIGICVCYDLSYRRVTDVFAREGAQAFIVPFMDVTEWGAQQHLLHARVGPMRAREYGVPVFRVGSSGISQRIEPTGRVVGSASFPGQEEMISGEMQVGPPAGIPMDAVLAPVCTLVTGLFAAWMPFSGRRHLH